MQAALCGEQTVGASIMIPTEFSTLLALRPRGAAKALSISARLLWELTKNRQIPCVRIGSGKRKTVLYPVAELQAWLTHQAAQEKGDAE
jgi:hypothetical protein